MEALACRTSATWWDNIDDNELRAFRKPTDLLAAKTDIEIGKWAPTNWWRFANDDKTQV
jgi:hypothetical protein